MAYAQTRALQNRPIALALALLANAAILCRLALGGRNWPTMRDSVGQAIQVWLGPPVQPQRPAKPAARAPVRSLPPALPQAAAQHAAPASATPASGSLAPSAGDGAARSSDAGVAAALRGSSGCAEADAPWMSDAERAACRQRLAAGAAAAPHLQGMAPAKHAYYAAVAKTEADWLSGRNPGHLPAIGCGLFWGPGAAPKPPPHALVIGPCIIEPPRGSLDPDVDVPPIGEAVDPDDVVPVRQPPPPPEHNPLYKRDLSTGW